MFRKIALATITAAALVAPPSLVHAGVSVNGVSINGHNLNGVSINGHNLNGVSINGHNLNGHNLNGVSINGHKVDGVEPAGPDVYFVGKRTGGESSTVLTIDLPQYRVTR
jgi:uncharacterized protein YjbI with pentapeptide repeats